MDMNALSSFIGSYGFPIVACAALFWQLNKIEENHKTEVTRLSDVLENNTLAITKLCERLDRLEDTHGT